MKYAFYWSNSLHYQCCEDVSKMLFCGNPLFKWNLVGYWRLDTKNENNIYSLETSPQKKKNVCGCRGDEYD